MKVSRRCCQTSICLNLKGSSLACLLGRLLRAALVESLPGLVCVSFMGRQSEGFPLTHFPGNAQCLEEGVCACAESFACSKYLIYSRPRDVPLQPFRLCRSLSPGHEAADGNGLSPGTAERGSRVPIFPFLVVLGQSEFPLVR